MQAEKEAVELYRQFAKFPQTTEATFSKARCGDAHVINTVQSQRDLERTANIKFSKSYFVRVPDSGNCEVIFTSNPQEISNEIWNKESPSGKYRAIVRKVTDKKQDEKYFIEVWDGSHKVENIDALSFEKHGKIYDADGYFGCLAWSNREDKLLYVAEKKYKMVSFFVKNKEENDGKTKEDQEPKPIPGEEYVFREEWGEGLVGKHHPVLCVLTIATGEVSLVEGVPNNVSPGQAIWSPRDEGIIFTGWQHEPFRLGLMYCPIRKSSLLHVNLQTGQCDVLSSGDKSSRCPVLSPDKSHFVYLQNRDCGPHMQCSELLLYDLKNKTSKTVVQEVHQAKLGDFPGLYTLFLPEDCWAADSQRVVISTIWNSQICAIVINQKTGHVTRLPTVSNCSMTVLGVQDDIVVAQCSSPCRPFYLVVGKLPGEGQEENIRWFSLESSQEVLEDVDWKIFRHRPTADRVNSKYPSLEYESILVYNTRNNKSKKLAIFPHGGPHSVYTTDFMLYPSLLCKLGFSSLLVNYRGSGGFGSDSIYSLLSNIGDQDVKDVQSAALEIIEKEGYDKDKVVVWGWSHGGFLTCHLVGQYPGFYKAAVSINPVINIATMVGSTDIPDWCATESGEDYSHSMLPTPDVAEKMWKFSPLQYVDKISTPVMIMIGNDDKRVPPSQSYELYTALKSRNLPVRFIAYPDNGHPIIKVDSEADAFINIYKWFMEHVPEK